MSKRQSHLVVYQDKDGHLFIDGVYGQYWTSEKRKDEVENYKWVKAARAIHLDMNEEDIRLPIKLN